MKKLLLASVATVLLAFPAKGYAADKFEFDTVHSQIIFFVDHLGFSLSEGEFLDWDGHILFDQENPENSSVEVVIDTTSIDMDDEKWNNHMKNEDFFHVEKYPTMTFKSTGIEVTGENTANITGDLTILDTTKPVVLAVMHRKTGPSPRGDGIKTGFSATTTIKRSEWGMNYGLPMVGDDVEIRIEIEGNKVEDEAAGDTAAE
ncbi:MAG: YceI family protein [Alphaproteobacteria bacterium]